MNEFEQKLQRQPVKTVPPEWRTEILAAARAAQGTLRVARPAARSLVASFRSRLSSLFWPHPVAWAGLAAIWLGILAVNFSIRDRAPLLADKAAPPSPGVVAQLHNQQRLFAELMGSRAPRAADRPKVSSPQPRSELSEWMVG